MTTVVEHAATTPAGVVQRLRVNQVAAALHLSGASLSRDLPCERVTALVADAVRTAGLDAVLALCDATRAVNLRMLNHQITEAQYRAVIRELWGSPRRVDTCLWVAWSVLPPTNAGTRSTQPGGEVAR